MTARASLHLLNLAPEIPANVPRQVTDFADEIMRPLLAKPEPVYVIPGSDAEAHAVIRHPHKTVRHVRGTLRPRSIAVFLEGMKNTFQRNAAGSLDAVYHFAFAGSGATEATITIRAGKLTVETGLLGELLESGRIRPVIDKAFPFEQAKEALAYLEKGPRDARFGHRPVVGSTRKRLSWASRCRRSPTLRAVHSTAGSGSSLLDAGVGVVVVDALIVLRLHFEPSHARTPI